MDISRKSTATLIDELVTTSMKCWFAQEGVMANDTDKKVADAARLAQQTNARRNQLKRALDTRFEELDIADLEKTYV